ncbi:alpha-mannosidase [Diaminobutyricimonas aerilata]|uniref:Alpha-mannosidase n=1 Tax=Diaminobutyricimonas aerilata TaxID=1162967 RepID=A0A2M9CJ55_9MICO|nr:glycoside hydrolase family 38 C-terminal domain-containing protein [Diaminobutyricimonas aerilata]PJJ71922.1 alpha-mannosidase [Diaminobutyricimonas aerilata]
MHDNSRLVEARIQRFYRERVVGAAHARHVPLAIAAYTVPGEPVPFAEAVTQQFEPFEPGTLWGRPWGTTWFRVSGTIPEDWSKHDGAIELSVDLGFTGAGPGFQAEGLVHTTEGRILKALEPLNGHVRLDGKPGDDVELLIEAASNPNIGGEWSFQPTPLGDLETAGDEPLYRFGHARIVQVHSDAWELERDMWTLLGLLGTLPAESARRATILRTLERAVDVLDPHDVRGTAAAGREVLGDALDRPAVPTAHRVVAVGHAHIDSAWLWPVRETIRKCARTFSNVLDLMDEDPDFVFACSSAQQYEWMRLYYPELFERIRERVAEGRFVPVGGMWVESDTNLPGGEAMARQFVHGKGFFLREFGVEPREVWLPDSFGYSAAMPQIVKAAGSEFFLTQKASWNETNVMPHHSFLWEGIDGSRVFTHFPPVDTYNSDLSAVDLDRAERQYAEKGVSDLSLVPFGYGDGGGGPTREMLATAHRKEDLEGSPRVRLDTPTAFFEEARDTLPNPPVWSGEIYLEFHRGTYTSQARTKRGNRRSEHLLREAELWAATAAVRTGAEYPADALRSVWETVLLQQFHDILPGSSIAWVHQQAEREYARVAIELEQLIASSIGALAGEGDTELVFNASPFPVHGAPALGAAPSTDGRGVRVSADGDRFVFEGSRVRAEFDAAGLLVSLVDLVSGRESVAPGEPGNLLQLFRDTPNQWDAWDIDAAYSRVGTDLVEVERIGVVSTSAGEALEIVRTFGGSRVRQVVTLDDESGALLFESTVDWHERQKLLKLAFGFDVHADRASYEVQFGHVHRATHANTSWDVARFETSAHRWVHVGEPGFGVAVANDSTYGHDITRHTREGGGTTTVVRESLLRAPLFPDPGADQGEHVLRTAVRIGVDALGAAEQGYRLNLPVRAVRGSAPVEPLVTVDDPAVVVEAVKLAEDGSGDVVVRLYEATGGRSTARLTPGFPAGAAVRTDLLERPLATQPEDPTLLRLRPFEIVTVRIPRA